MRDFGRIDLLLAVVIGGACLALVATGVNFWITVAVFAVAVVVDVAAHVGFGHRARTREEVRLQALR
jgi:membrane protein implicated in regulation of membrane protease activity